MSEKYRNSGPKPIRQHDGSRVEVGETFSPTEGQLRAFGDQLEPVEEDAEGEEDESTAEEAAEADEEAGGEADPDEVLAEYVEDPTDYSQLSDLAEEVDGVPAAGLSTEDLRQRLAEELAE